MTDLEQLTISARLWRVGFTHVPARDSFRSIVHAATGETVHPALDALQAGAFVRFIESTCTQRDLLVVAFDRVRQPGDWKAPIRAMIDRADLAVTAEAVEYFTATELRVLTDHGDQLVIEADGYRAGPAGP